MAVRSASVSYSKVTLAAGIPLALVAPAKWMLGVRILNWTASPVYVSTGTSGTPPSGAPSDFIAAAVAGVPGIYEPPFVPSAGLMGVGASAGDLTVLIY